MFISSIVNALSLQKQINKLYKVNKIEKSIFLTIKI